LEQTIAGIVLKNSKGVFHKPNANKPMGSVLKVETIPEEHSLSHDKEASVQVS